ncbi:putative sodium/metabolite cotransporter BASS1 [Hibiscus syriacus]|uniref:Sodium/metabolite cotransporter BASS1 n=1 Tax=Hibiscus syriacus TaxID=106335 RepID=A0A6A3B9Y0_HIBSY|nr:putative sodium/metabolite cotransporter BASS1 [Hibiscus syriacus]
MGFFGMSYWAPSSFNWMTPKWSIYGLTLTMLGMGTTLTLDDLRGALAMPKELIAGFVLQYTVMPLSGCFLSKLLNLPSHYAAGLILVGCCPGGTASNIVTYLAGGNVALSVLMTAASTLSAVNSGNIDHHSSKNRLGYYIIMTPFLTTKMAGKYVAVDAVGLRNTTLQVVLLPVLAGAFLNQYFSGLVKPVSPLMLSIAVVTVGILNMLLGLVPAAQHFRNPPTAVPCAVSSVSHSVLGSLLARICRSNAPKQKQE